MLYCDDYHSSSDDRIIDICMIAGVLFGTVTDTTTLPTNEPGKNNSDEQMMYLYKFTISIMLVKTAKAFYKAHSMERFLFSSSTMSLLQQYQSDPSSL